MNEQAQKLLEAILPFREDYVAMHVRTIAFRWKKQWMNLATRALLVTQRPKPTRPLTALPGLPELLLEEAISPIGELERLLQVLDTGELTLKGTPINCKRVNPPDSPYSAYFRSYTRSGARDWLGLDTYCCCLAGSEGTIEKTIGHDGFERLESRIASVETPFRGVGDLVQAYTGHMTIGGSRSYSTIEIIAPLWIRLGSDCTLDSRKIVVAALMRKGHNREDVSVGLVQSDGQEVVSRNRRQFSKAVLAREANLYLETQYRLSGRANRVTLLLSYKGELVDRLELFRNRIGGRNPKMAVVASVDPGLDRLREGIGGKAKKPGAGFEEAIVTLLSLLGFSCLHVGGEDRNPDVIAWAVDPAAVFVIECTTAEPDLRNKATKFAARLRHLRTMAAESEVIGILATTLPQDAINPADLERLKTDRVILIDAGGLEELAKLADNGASVGEAVEKLQQFASAQHISQLRFHRMTPEVA